MGKSLIMRGSRVISRSPGGQRKEECHGNSTILQNSRGRGFQGRGRVHWGMLGEADEESKLDIGLRGVRKGHYAIM